MKVLGIDPGVARLGWGIVSEKSGSYQAQAYGCLITKKGILPEKRLEFLFNNLTKLINKHNPEEMAVEDLFFAANAKTALQVGQARGIILLAAALKKLPLTSYTPLKIKMAIVGYGRADKGQVQKMVGSILKLQNMPKLDDTADALAVALTHLFLNKFERKIGSLIK